MVRFQRAILYAGVARHHVSNRFGGWDGCCLVQRILERLAWLEGRDAPAFDGNACTGLGIAALAFGTITYQERSEPYQRNRFAIFE